MTGVTYVSPFPGSPAGGTPAARAPAWPHPAEDHKAEASICASRITNAVVPES